MVTYRYFRLVLAAGILAAVMGGVAMAGEPWRNQTAVTVDAANRNADRIRRSRNARNNRINAVNNVPVPAEGGWCR